MFPWLQVTDATKILLLIGGSMFIGLILTRPATKIGLPSVTAYLIAGLLIGPTLLGRFGLGFHSFEQVESLSIFSDVALGFIAFDIGKEFKLSELKKTGKQAAVVAVVQALSATLLVDVLLLAVYFIFDLGSKGTIGISTCICLGAIATATAPAATMMVVKQYNAKGPVTKILLPVVALDDAVGLIVFAVSFGIAKTIQSGASIDVVTVIVNPLSEIVLSLVLGAGMGFLFTVTERMFHSRTNRISVSVTYVLLTVALSFVRIDIPGTEFKISFSSLLVCMMVGMVFCNTCEFADNVMERIERWTGPLYALFFVMSGAQLDLTVFGSLTIVLIGLVYIVARTAGKYIGAYASSRAMKCEPQVQKYLGITLLPQAGVALGMSVTVAAELGEEGKIIRSIVLFAVMIYELVGPTLTKIALTKAGEIKKGDDNFGPPIEAANRG